MKRSDASPNLLVSLAFDKTTYKASEPQKLVFSLTNESDKPIRVLKWHTPLEGFKSNMFHVEYAGKRAVYLGRVYKRGAPTENDYITIEPGKTVKQAADFTEAYDIAEAAHYSVKYKTGLLHVGTEEPKLLMKRYMAPRAAAPVTVKSNTAVFKLEENRTPKTLNGVEVAWMKMMKSTGPAKKHPLSTAVLCRNRERLRVRWRRLSRLPRRPGQRSPMPQAGPVTPRHGTRNGSGRMIPPAIVP